MAVLAGVWTGGVSGQGHLRTLPDTGGTGDRGQGVRHRQADRTDEPKFVAVKATLEPLAWNGRNVSHYGNSKEGKRKNESVPGVWRALDKREGPLSGRGPRMGCCARLYLAQRQGRR